jgi:hypothetical protein
VRPGLKAEGISSVLQTVISAKASWLGIVSLLVAFAGTCGDPTPPVNLRIGVTLHNGEVTALYVLCPGELTTDVRLYTGKGVVVGDKDDTLLWRISAKNGADVGTFPVNSVPPGFVERQSAAEELPKSGVLSFTVTSTSQNIAARPFRMGQLQPGMVVSYPGRVMPAAEFFARAQRQCVHE